MLQNDPVVVQYQEDDTEERVLVPGQTNAGRLLAVVYTERQATIRVVTAYSMRRRQFRSEEEEAKWWEGHPGFIADQFEKAAKEGRIWRGLPGHGGTRSVTIRLATKDLEIAQALAGKAGMPYPTYIKSVLHRALERERKAG